MSKNKKKKFEVEIKKNVEIDAKNNKNGENNTKDREELEKNLNFEETKNIATMEAEYFFGHEEGEDIFDCFLTNKMIAHRGLWDKDHPENSLGAFKNAVQAGYSIEFDVNPLEDSTPVVFHDSKLSRMTGEDGYIQNLTKEECDKLRLLDSDEKIPTLEDVLRFVDGKVPLLIEIKSQDKIGELEKKVFDLLKNYRGQYAIQSFNPYTLGWFYQNAPKIWRGQLSSYFKGTKLGSLKKFVLKRLGMKKVAHHDFVSYDISNLPNRFTRKLDVPLLTWTVQSQQQYIKAIQIADNVIFEGFEPKI